MSVELDWHALDAELTASVVAFLNSAFALAARPNFLGDLDVTSFSFGDTQPSIELLDVRDIYKEFLEVDDDEQWGSMLATNAPPRSATASAPLDDRRSSSPSDYRTHDSQSLTGASLYGTKAIPARTMSHLRPSSALFSPGLNRSYMSHSPTPPPFQETCERSTYDDDNNDRNDHEARRQRSLSLSEQSGGALSPPSTSSSPSLQLHLRVSYSGNLSIGLATSLLINYPSPNFMALPLKLSISSLAFEGVMLVAFEGDRRRLHISLVDPTNGHGGLGVASAGARLLSGAVVESEVGQTDKHVLKNVGKVEKFVLDVARSTLESELVFPNFQTVLF